LEIFYLVCVSFARTW